MFKDEEHYARDSSFETLIVVKYPWLIFFFREEILNNFIVHDVLFASLLVTD